jgi:hypothetical protein
MVRFLKNLPSLSNQAILHYSQSQLWTNLWANSILTWLMISSRSRLQFKTKAMSSIWRNYLCRTIFSASNSSYPNNNNLPWSSKTIIWVALVAWTRSVPLLVPAQAVSSDRTLSNISHLSTSNSSRKHRAQLEIWVVMTIIWVLKTLSAQVAPQSFPSQISCFNNSKQEILMHLWLSTTII